MNWRFLAGLVLGFLIGFTCRKFAIPAPAPPVLEGALLVVMMTVGYTVADRYLSRKQAKTLADCGGPSGH